MKAYKHIVMQVIGDQYSQWVWDAFSDLIEIKPTILYNTKVVYDSFTKHVRIIYYQEEYNEIVELMQKAMYDEDINRLIGD